MIYLPTYFILGVRTGNIMDDFSTAPETQNEAIEVIEQFMADEEGFRELERESNSDEKSSGPRRVEVLIQERNPGLFPARQQRLVVTAILSPSGHFNTYTVSGRVWRDMLQNDLASQVVTFASEGIDILEIFIFGGSEVFREETEVFSTESTKQAKAWRTLEREHRRLGPQERIALVTWSGGEASASKTTAGNRYPETEPYDKEPHTHWTQRAPSVYNKAAFSAVHKAYFRVAGDDIGIKLHQDHRKKTQAATLDIVVVPDSESPTGKPVPAKAAKVVGAKMPIAFVPSEEFQFCYCGMPACENCHITSIVEEQGARGNRHTIH